MVRTTEDMNLYTSWQLVIWTLHNIVCVQVINLQRSGEYPHLTVDLNDNSHSRLTETYVYNGFISSRAGFRPWILSQRGAPASHNWRWGGVLVSIPCAALTRSDSGVFSSEMLQRFITFGSRLANRKRLNHMWSQRRKVCVLDGPELQTRTILCE